MAEDASTERRGHKRLHFVKEVEVIGVGMRRCSDLSIGGMYLETVAGFPVGNLLNLRFKLRDTDEQTIEVHAHVIYGHHGVGVGLGFINLSPDNHKKIQEFLEKAG